MDKKKSVLNVIISILGKVSVLVARLIVRRYLIRCCGNEANGLNDLYLSILGFLAVAELGIGSAITFCMYRPIVEGDSGKVAALFHLLRRLYLAVGGVILLAGLGLIPFLHHFARDYAQLDVNLYATFALMLISVVITYLFGAETALINAYKNNYITTAITSGGMVLQSVLQILALVLTGSFFWYLACRILAVLAQWGLTRLLSQRRYPHITKERTARIDRETRQQVVRNVKALFMHKIGALLVNTVDSLVISTFIGVILLGKYSNYATVMTALKNLLALCFSSLSSVLGHLYVEQTKQTTRRYCDTFHLVNFFLGTVFYLGYYAVIDDLVALLFGADLILSRSVAMVTAMNGFVQFLRQTALTFRDSTGTFYNDRWKPLFEGLTNLVLSVLLVRSIGVTGVIVATIITNLLICHIVEPYVLYKYAFETSPAKYYARNYSMIAIFFGALLVLDRTMFRMDSFWRDLLANGFLSVGISLVACTLALLLYRRSAADALALLKGREAKS